MGVKIKVAVVYDYLCTKGGGQLVALILAKTFDSDVWTTEYEPKKTFKDFSVFRIFPHKLKFYPRRGLTEIEALHKFRKMGLSDYDIIISTGDWAKHIGIQSDNHPQIHYGLVPLRPLYDLYENTKKRLSFFERQVFKIWALYVRKLDQEATSKIDVPIAFSQNVRRRIRKYYSRDVKVIYLPINVKKFKRGKSEDYFLSVQRIEPEKRLEIQIEAFRKMPDERLIIVGSPTERAKQYFEELRKTAPKNVKFVGAISDEKLIELYSRCRAAVQTSIDEDLGLVPIEAMASGKPCIAVNEGGFKETIINGKTGILINRPYVENFVKAIKNFDLFHFKASYCLKRAKRFSEKKFVKEMKKIVKQIYKS